MGYKMNKTDIDWSAIKTNKKLDDKTIVWLKSRIWEKIDNKAKAEIIEVAKSDIYEYS